MADYNIYIHAFSGESSPTTPFQLRESGESAGGSESPGGGSAFTAITRMSAFISNPDSMIGNVASTATGTIGKASIGFAFLIALAAIVKKSADYYIPIVASASGDYGFQIAYNNFNQTIHNILTPFSTEFQRRRNVIEINKKNAKNEQERILTGGTIYGSQYGRYL